MSISRRAFMKLMVSLMGATPWALLNRPPKATVVDEDFNLVALETREGIIEHVREKLAEHAPLLCETTVMSWAQDPTGRRAMNTRRITIAFDKFLRHDLEVLRGNALVGDVAIHTTYRQHATETDVRLHWSDTRISTTSVIAESHPSGRVDVWIRHDACPPAISGFVSPA